MSDSKFLPLKQCPNNHCRKSDNTDFSTCRYCGTSYSAKFNNTSPATSDLPVLQIVLGVGMVVAYAYFFYLNHSQPQTAGAKFRPVFRSRGRGLAIPIAAAMFFSKKALADADQDIRTANVSLLQDSNNGDAYIKRGDAYWTKFMLNEAIADYSSAIALNPSRAEAYDKRANVYEMKKCFSEAQSDRQRAKDLRQAGH